MSVPAVAGATQTSLALVTAFIRRQHALHLQLSSGSATSYSNTSNTTTKPLLVALQGPQGSGKSYLSSALPTSLLPLRCISISLDDFYLPHSGLSQLMPGDNTLLHGRGLPGTHDLPLLEKVMGELSRGEAAELPGFDKSQFGGVGDRRTETVKVEAGSYDVVVLEGWMMGFLPLSEEKITSRYNSTPKPPQDDTAATEYFRTHSLSALLATNDLLKSYLPLWSLFPSFVQLVPHSPAYVWQWRLQQEHNMKSANGGKGMDDDAVRKFVERYMPAYELWLGGIRSDEAKWWKGRGFGVEIGKDREVLSTEEF